MSVYVPLANVPESTPIEAQPAISIPQAKTTKADVWPIWRPETNESTYYTGLCHILHQMHEGFV